MRRPSPRRRSPHAHRSRPPHSPLAHACSPPAHAAPLGGSAAYCVAPRRGSFLAFDGDLLHGVLPGRYDHAERGAAERGGASAASGQRLTLLIAWYTEPLADRATRRQGAERGGARAGQRAAGRRRLGACASVPRPSRSQTWPRELELAPEAAEADAASVSRHGPPSRLPVHRSSGPVWVPVPPRALGALSRSAREPAAAALPPVEPPEAPRQHFFLHEADEVGKRLRAEHGVGGTWADGGARTKRQRPRA